MPPEIPWPALRAEFTSAEWGEWLSLRAFAEQHDVPLSALRRRAKRERWLYLRERRAARARLARGETKEREAMVQARRTAWRLVSLLSTKGADRTKLYAAARAADSSVGDLMFEIATLDYFRRDLANLEKTGRRLTAKEELARRAA